MAAEVDYYRYYMPVAPTINVFVKPDATNTVSAQSANVYNGTYSGQTMIDLGFTPYGVDTVDVFVNNVNIINKIVNSVTGGFTRSRFNITGSMLTWITPPNPGDVIQVVSYLNFSEPSYYRIDLTNLLIQGAIHTSSEDKFTGSVECYPVIMHQPAYGVVRPAWDRQGFEYSFLSSIVGPNYAIVGDSFAYKLVSRYGQESEPACILINQGV